MYLEAKIKLTRENETLHIHQYIIGTGGAELDSYTNPPQLQRQGKIVNTNIMYDYQIHRVLEKVVFGYANCTVSGNDLNCSFITISKNSSKTKSTKRRLKRSSSTKKTYDFSKWSL